MPARWIPVRRARAAATAPLGTDESVPAERHFPAASVVLFHGLLAVATLVLVLLTALGW
ncbi:MULTISPECIES: hypothetical protein [Streptomyces]|uniref:hypothetical protein n=1 Tax=Streptomyces TaxID=1883 RepID=UPI001CCF575F|nr:MULTISPECIES: hypothetical protein [Streptomyces]UBI39125.1 hypothetical protein K7I03_23510 [Streptomyces mobaraensis]UKW31705.1 hypothetical protein MCU78_23455 [Streptomyces sp. TYQ1024]